MARRKRFVPAPPDPAAKNWWAAAAALRGHPLLAPLFGRAHVSRPDRDSICPPDGWIGVTEYGRIDCHPTRWAEPEEWTYAIAHGLLHLAFGHLANDAGKRAHEWTAACCAVVARFLAELRIGTAPPGFGFVAEGLPRAEEALYQHFFEHGVPKDATLCSPGGLSCDNSGRAPARRVERRIDWEWLFGRGLAEAVSDAVELVGGRRSLTSGSSRRTLAQDARSWFVSSYPLLGAMAARFEVVEDHQVCQRMQVSVAAVDVVAGEIYVNPAAGLSLEETRFVLAHELLHVGLRHASRRQGRDPFLWNAACDFVINGWLAEMGVGSLPTVGGLHDPRVKGESAEAVYDRLLWDLRRARRLRSLRGVGLCDILDREATEGGCLGEGMSMDEFCRSALLRGLLLHGEQGRGSLPEGLIEEIWALSQPPIPWDVELANWFAHHFPPIQKVRTYAQLSRRQSATPDIPRPRWVVPPPDEAGRTFGVVLDTSGSMDRRLLGQALGAVASYSLARDVPAARVIFCDAAAYDAGYLAPEAIAQRIQVKGRGGTVLQPGIDLLERAEDFPKDGPILVITDGYCDILRIRRDHAFLIPEGNRLPFKPAGPVFRIG